MAIFVDQFQGLETPAQFDATLSVRPRPQQSISRGSSVTARQDLMSDTVPIRRPKGPLLKPRAKSTLNEYDQPISRRDDVVFVLPRKSKHRDDHSESAFCPIGAMERSADVDCAVKEFDSSRIESVFLDPKLLDRKARAANM